MHMPLYPINVYLSNDQLLFAQSGMLSQGCQLYEIQHGGHRRGSLWHFFLPGKCLSENEQHKLYLLIKKNVVMYTCILMIR